MTLHELWFLAQNQGYCYLTIPRKTLPRGDKVRLSGRYGPLGRICTVGENEDGYYVVAVFESKKIIAFLKDAIEET